MTTRKKATAEAVQLVAYKGFSKGWGCNGFAYEVGKSYEHKGTVKLCASGFHACLAPLDCLSYYGLTDDSHYAEVLLEDVSADRQSDTKVVARRITVVRELGIDDLIKAQIAWTAKQKDAQTSSGDYSKAASSGDSSQAASSGNYSKAASSGYSSQAASSGNYSQAASSGDYSQAASSGDSSQAASSGNYSQAASSGDYSKAASSGDYSQAASSGNYSKAASSGYSSQAASSGNYSQAASSGNYSKAASSGDSSQAACDTNGFACVAGVDGRVCGKAGSALSLGYQDRKKRNRIAVAYVGEDGIEPSVWYRANSDGKFVKA